MRNQRPFMERIIVKSYDPGALKSSNFVWNNQHFLIPQSYSHYTEFHTLF